jgi:hypothetical protein
MIDGTVAVDLVPQGTLIERIRAAGHGLGGVLTPTGVGTLVEDGKRVIEVDGKAYLLETALRADFALVHAMMADYFGNLRYVLTARNFNRSSRGGRHLHCDRGAHPACGRDSAGRRDDARRQWSTSLSRTPDPRWNRSSSSPAASRSNCATTCW